MTLVWIYLNFRKEEVEVYLVHLSEPQHLVSINTVEFIYSEVQGTLDLSSL